MTVILRKGASLLPGILLILFASAQVPKSTKAKSATPKKSSTASKKPPEKVSENTLLWQISGNGLKKPSYIFGTMHLLCKDDARLGDSLKKAIAQTDQVYFELDLDDMNEIMSTMKYIRMNDNVKLADLVTADEYDRIKKY